jgi:hypothetical protein
MKKQSTRLLTHSARRLDACLWSLAFPLSHIAKAQNMKFLEIIIDSNLSWKQHIDDKIPKLIKTCFEIRSVKHFMSLEVMRLIYFSYFYSVLSYGIIFWGDSMYNKYIFKIQKRTIRIITNGGIRDSCRDLFKKLQILFFILSTYTPYSCL